MAKVLVVDDTAFMRLMLKNILTKMGYTDIVEAVNGVDAVDKYSQYSPELVTMDITMPEMDGLHAVRAIKALDSNAKIIMCSAMGQKEMVIDAIKSGAKDFIVKPFQEEKVVEVIEKVIAS